MSYPFLCCGIPTNILQKTFYEWWCMFNTFVSNCAVAFCTAHGQNKTCKFDTKGFVPVDSLCGIFGSSSLFTKFLVDRTGNIWSVVQIHEIYIYWSETHAWTIIECVIFRNVRHDTSTWSFISWCSGATNSSRTPCTEMSSWNSLEVNCAPASVLILYISHQPASSNFPNISWNISSLSMTYSVVTFSIP